jgi:Mlc titration factor MtfA (ptsG expression regulator)
MRIIIVLVVIAAVLFWLWRDSVVKKVDIPSEWDDLLEKHVRFYQLLNTEEKKEFQDQMAVFLYEVSIDAVRFKLEEIDRVFVAASAIIPVFRFRNWRYTNITGVIIYPNDFNDELGFGSDAEDKRIAGRVITGNHKAEMILSRKSLHHGFKNKTDKNNTGVHEFVHLLDNADGKIDGIPVNFLGQEYIIPWLNLMHKGMEDINNDKSDIRAYGGTKQAEFFTVASEYFFERPKLLRRKHPELYEMLERCYNPEKNQTQVNK